MQTSKWPCTHMPRELHAQRGTPRAQPNSAGYLNIGPLPAHSITTNFLPPYYLPLTHQNACATITVAGTDRAVSPFPFHHRGNMGQNGTEKTTSLTHRQLAALPHIAASQSLSQDARSWSHPVAILSHHGLKSLHLARQVSEEGLPTRRRAAPPVTHSLAHLGS